MQANPFTLKGTETQKGMTGVSESLAAVKNQRPLVLIKLLYLFEASGSQTLAASESACGVVKTRTAEPHPEVSSSAHLTGQTIYFSASFLVMPMLLVRDTGVHGLCGNLLFQN